jgi:nitrilase
MSSRCVVAAVQMVSGTSVVDNLTVAEGLIAQAVAAGASLVVLPEYFCLMGLRDRDKLDIAEPFGDGMIQSWLSAQAAHHRIMLIGGSMPIRVPQDDNKVFNTMLVFNADGVCVSRYDKLHLFRFQRGLEFYDESIVQQAGEHVVTTEGLCGQIGLSVCYDLRFPELYRKMGRVNLIIMAASFIYTTGKAHWLTLLRARAIENQCYVLAAAQGGEHQNHRTTFGHSCLINPWGEVVSCVETGAGVVTGEVDLDYLAAVREQLPALQHCRL